MDLDALLDEALDDLDSRHNAVPVNVNVSSSQSASTTPTVSDGAAEDDDLEKFKAAFTEMLRTVNPASAASNTSGSSSEQSTDASEDPFERALKMFEQASKMREQPAGGPSELAGMSDEQLEEMLKKLMAEIGASGGDESSEGTSDEAIAQLMSQVTSKEVFGPAMESIRAKFPAWLEKNRPNLSTEEFERYQKQQALFNVCN